MRNLNLSRAGDAIEVGEKSNLSPKLSYLFFIAAIAVLLFIVSLYWFYVFSYQTLMGDDLAAVYAADTGTYVSNFWQGLTSLVSASKYRPVFTSVFSLEIQAFGSNFQAYVILNILLELVNVGLITLIAYKVSGRNRWVAVCTGLATMFIRFNFYYVMQLYGFMEGMALLFLLLIIYFALQAYQLKSSRTFIYLNVFFFLLIFTHERYLGVVGFMVLFGLLIPGTFKNIFGRLGWAAVPILILLFNFAVKTFAFKVGFITEAGRPINSFSQTLNFIYDGFLNLIGFNVGPNYLSALNINETKGIGYGLGFASLCLLVVGSALYLVSRFIPFKKAGLLNWLRGVILFGALFGSLLLSASVTNLQEYRWLYSPYVVLMLGFAYLLGAIKYKYAGAALAILFLIVSMVSNIYYRNYTGNIYFFWSMAVSDSAKVNILDKYGADLANRDLYIVSNGNASLQKFVLFYNSFFNHYLKPLKITAHYVETTDDILIRKPDVTKLLVFNLKDNRLDDLTAPVVAELQKSASSQATGTPYFDFVSRFKEGKINDDREFQSPSNRGVLLMTLPNSIGSSNNLTIISGFNYRYENVSLKSQTYLVFEAAKIYNIGDSATLYVEATGADGKPRRILEVELPQADKDTVKWQDFSIPLPQNLDDKVTLTFGVDSHTGEASADWVGLNHVYLVAP